MLLEIEQLTKEYQKGVRANDGISFGVDTGQVFGLLGHNGAGKTTLVRQIVGLTLPTSGTIRIDGRDSVADPAFARRVCSLQAQAQVPITGLSPRQAIELIGQIRGGRQAMVRQRTRELVEALDIGAWFDAPGERLSGGVRRLVAFAMAAVEPGRVVILDEPTNDVDPVRRRLLWEQVRTLADRGCAVLLVTHNVHEAERAVDRLAIIDQGRIVASGTPAELKADMRDRLRLDVVFEAGTPPIEPPAVALSSTRAGRRLLITLPASQAGSAVTWADELRRTGIVEEFALSGLTVEDRYIQMLSGERDHEMG